MLQHLALHRNGLAPHLAIRLQDYVQQPQIAISSIRATRVRLQMPIQCLRVLYLCCHVAATTGSLGLNHKHTRPNIIEDPTSELEDVENTVNENK